MNGTDITLRIVDGWTLGALADEEPRIRDLDLGDRLGYERPRDVRKLIDRLEQEGKIVDVCRRATVARRGFAEETIEERWLTLPQALKVAAKSETQPADEILDEMIAVFIAAKSGALPAVAPALTNDAAVEHLVTASLHAGKKGAAVAFLNAARALEKPAAEPAQRTLIDVGTPKPKPVDLAPYRARILAVAEKPIPGGLDGLATRVGGKSERTRAAIREMLAEGKLVRSVDSEGRVHITRAPSAEVH